MAEFFGARKRLSQSTSELRGVKKDFKVLKEKNKSLTKVARAHFIKIKEGEEGKTNIATWAKWLIEDTKLWGGMTDARLLTVCKAATLQLEELNNAPVTENADEQLSPDKRSLRDKSYKAATKLGEKIGAGWKRTVSNFLGGCSREALSELLPDRISEFVQEGKENLMQKISDHYNVEHLLDLKIRCKLSRRNYTELRRYLCKMQDSNGLWVPLKIDGVEVIPFAGEKALRNVMKAIASEYGVRKVNSNTVAVSANTRAARDFTAALRNKTATWRKEGDAHVVEAAGGGTICLQEVFDKAKMTPRLDQTAVGFAYPNLSQHPCSPEHTHEHCLAEGADNWASMFENLRSVFAEFNDILKRGFVQDVIVPKEITGYEEDIKVDVPVDCTVGSDQAGSHGGLGLGPCSGHCACPMCEIPAGDILSIDLTFLMKVTRRSLARLRLLAHLVPGDCPGCHARVVATKEELCACQKKTCQKCQGKKLMLVAKPGDKAPQRSKNDLDSWLKQHFNVCCAQGPLIEVEPGKWVICILHMNLRIVGALFEHTILKEMGIHFNTAVTKEEVATFVWETCVKKGIPMKLKKCPVSKTDSYWVSVGKHSFAGPDCAILLEDELWLTLLDRVISPEARAKNIILDGRYLHIVAAWRKWVDTWAIINKLDFNTKKEKADTVQQAACDFIPLFKKACAVAPRTLYLHLLVSHLPEQIESLPVDPYYYQTQGLEHRHKIRKQMYQLMCNKRKPGEARVTTVAAYSFLNGKACPSFTRSTGTDRIDQLMELVVVRDHVRQLLSNYKCEVAQQVKLERENKLKRARGHAARL